MSWRETLCAAALCAAGCADRPAPPPAAAGGDGGGEAAAIEGTARRGPVRLRVRAEPRDIGVGEKLTLVLEVTAPEGVAVRMPALTDSLGPFTIRHADTPPDVPEVSGGGEGERMRGWTHTYVLDTFAAGEAEIPPITVTFTDSRAARTEGEAAPAESSLSTEPLSITVRSALEAEASPGDFHDIKSAAEVAVPISRRAKLIALGAVVAGAAAIAALVWWRRRRRAEAGAAPAVPPDAWALGELERLAAEGLVERGEHHAYYVRLSGIVRGYVERRFGLMAPERTTAEFLREARRSSALESEDRALLGRFLPAADMVKFALHRPSVRECSAALAAARRFVERTRPAADTGVTSSGGAREEAA